MTIGKSDPVLVAGAGGFIGGHLVRHLLASGCTDIRAVDRKPLGDWFQRFDVVESLQLDLSEKPACMSAAEGRAVIYNLAADMGGMGFIERFKAACMLSVLVNTHLLMAGKEHGAKRFFFASSACVYNAEKQTAPGILPLVEADAYPAMPEDGYGWEKLFSERMCRHFEEDYGLASRVARFHNVYGPLGTYDGGREKAPAAICRKLALAKLSGRHEIEIWGDGEQTRTFMFIDDCLHGIDLITASDTLGQPINLGSDEQVSINQLVSMAEEIAGIRVARRYDLAAPKGVRGRSSDNTLIKQVFGWAPSLPLALGLERTYRWIHDELASGRPAERFRKE